MKIVQVAVEKKKPCFGELHEGDCFLVGEDLAMKTNPIYTEYGDVYNAVSLSDGAFYEYSTEEIIIPVVAEVHWAKE